MFLPGGRTIVTGGSEGAIEFWDLGDGRRTGSLFVEEMRGKSDMALSPDGKLLATVLESAGLAVWDVARREPLFRVGAAADRPVYLTSVVFSPDGTLIATTGEDRAVRLWNATSGEAFLVLRPGGTRQDRLTVPVFSPNGRLLASSDEAAISVWDLEAADGTRRFEHGKGHLAQPGAFTADGKQLICVEYQETAEVPPLGGAVCDWEIVLRDPTSGEKVRAWSAGRHQQFSGCNVRLAPHGKWLLGAFPSKLVIWELATGKVVRTIDSSVKTHHYPPHPHGIDISPDGSLVAVCQDDHTVGVWETATGRRRLEFAEAHTQYLPAVCISPGGRLAATAERRGSIRLWELPSAKHVRELRLGGIHLRSMAFSPDGKLLIAGGETLDRVRVRFGGVVKVWQVECGKLLHELEFEQRVRLMAISPDGKKLAVAACRLEFGGDEAGPPSAVHVMDLAKPRVIEKPLEIPSTAVSMAFDPGGTRLSTVDESATLRRWDLASGKKVYESAVTLKDERRLTYHAAHDASGSTVAVALGARISLRQTATGRELSSIPLKERNSERVAVSPDQRLIAVAEFCQMSDDTGRVKLLDAATGRVLATYASDRTWQTAIAFSPDGRSLIVGTGQGTALVYDVREAYKKLKAGK